MKIVKGYNYDMNQKIFQQHVLFLWPFYTISNSGWIEYWVIGFGEFYAFYKTVIDWN